MVRLGHCVEKQKLILLLEKKDQWYRCISIELDLHEDLKLSLVDACRVDRIERGIGQKRIVRRR